MVAAESDDVAFIVLLAGTGLNGEQILLLQTALISKASGVPQEYIDSNARMQEKIFHVLKTEPDSATASARIAALIRQQIDDMTPPRRTELGLDDPDAIDRTIRTQATQAMLPWMRFFLTYEPATALRHVKVPVLAINGSKDLQVPPKENLAAIEKALRESGNKDFTVKELPGLNHLFQTAGTGSPEEYATIEETMSPLALQTIADWINQRFGNVR
jgi:pimeloyl-ACP methyl ester carboxylesterase